MATVARFSGTKEWKQSKCNMKLCTKKTGHRYNVNTIQPFKVKSWHCDESGCHMLSDTIKK